MITSDPDTLLFEGAEGLQQQQVGIESQLRDLPIGPVLATNDKQVPSRLESLIKQLIVSRQMSTSPNVVIQRLNESDIVAAPCNTFDASLKMLSEHENDRYNQQDVLSTFTAHPKDKQASGTSTNLHTKKIKFQSIQHKPSEGNLVNPVIMHSQLCQQRSPTNQLKIGELPGEHNLSKEIEMESLLNYQELLNSKDILGSSLPISQTLHLALSNAMRGNDSSAQNSQLRPNSQVDHASFEAGASPQKQLSMQEKYDAKLLTNLNKNQQNFISLDLQPKSVGSEDIYEQTLMAFQKDLNQLHEIEQSRQEISYRIREHQRVLNRIHNVQSHNRGSFVLPQSNRQASNRQATHAANTQQASLDIAGTNMSQIDFAHLQRMTQNSVEPNFYNQRSQFIPSHLQQHYADQNDTQHSLDPKTQNVSIGDGQKITTSPTIGRYRLKGFHGAAYQPISNVYSNRNPSGVVQDKRTKSVRQRISRHLQPLANTSVGGGSNLRSVGRKFVLTQMNSGTKGYGTIEPPKKTQTGYIPLSSGLASIDQATKNQVATIKNKSTTIVYGPNLYSTIGSSSNRRSSVPKQRQQFSNLRPTLQLKDSKAIRSFSNRNRVIQQSLIQQNTSQNVARNTYASIGSGSLNSQNGYLYGLQNSSIENTKTTSTNALEAFLPEDRSISPHNLKSKTQAKPTARGELVQPRKVYKKSVSRGRGEGGVANSSFVPGIRKDSQISKGMHPSQLPKAAQMSHQHVVIRDSLQNETANSSIVRVNNNISMRISPNDKIFQTQAAYDNKAIQISPEKIKIQQLQKKLQLSEQNGIRQVRIRGNITRNYFSNDADAYSSDPMYSTHDITGQQDFRVGGQVIAGANNNANEKKNNLRYSRATYDVANGNMFDEEQVTSQEEHIPAKESQGRIKEEGVIQQRMMEIINEDNPFENPVTRSVGYLNSSTAVEKQAPTIQQAIKKARFTGQQWARISPFGQNSTPQNQTPQTATASLPMKQQINQVIKEEEAAAEQDEKTTIKESSRRDKKDSSSLDSVEDECMIGESHSPSQLKAIEQKLDEEQMDNTELSRAWEDQDVSKPVRGLNNFNQRVIARGSIKFGSGSQTQHLASLKVLPQKEPSVNTSNLFGVNLLEQQRLQQTSPKRSEQSSDSPITTSDGNLICESVRNPIDDSNCIVPHVTQSPLHNADLGPAERDIINQSNFNDVTNSRLFNTRLSNIVDQLELTDFPPLLKTQTNYQQSARSEAKHSDDEVSVRRALEESENCLKSDFDQNPQLQRQSTHSLLKKIEASNVQEDSEIDLESLKHNNLPDDFRDEGCETPNDLQVILENFYKKPRVQKGFNQVFNDDVVQLDQDDAHPESSDEYLRGPPKNNNFIGRPTTANFAGQRQQKKDSI